MSFIFLDIGFLLEMDLGPPSLGILLLHLWDPPRQPKSTESQRDTDCSLCVGTHHSETNVVSLKLSKQSLIVSKILFLVLDKEVES